MRIRRITSAVALAGAVMATTALATTPASGAVGSQDASAAARSRAIGSAGEQADSASDSGMLAFMRLKNRYSGLCAGVGSQTRNGAPVIQWGCNDSLDEIWDLIPTTDNNGQLAFFLKNEFSRKCMGVGSSLANGAGAIQYTCNDAVDEKWWWNSTARTFRNVYSGKCLEVPSTTTPGARVIQWTCNGGNHQKWN